MHGYVYASYYARLGLAKVTHAVSHLECHPHSVKCEQGQCVHTQGLRVHRSEPIEEMNTIYLTAAVL